MIKQINPKSIKGYRSYTMFTTHKSRDVFFEIQGTMPNVLAEFNNSLGNYIDQQVKQRPYPAGIFNVEIVVENKVFRITYSESKISKKEVLQFARSLNL